MSAALAEPTVEVQETPSLVQTKDSVSVQKKPADAHPLVPVFLFGALALVGAFVGVGTIVAILALRGTGLDAPF